MKPLPVYLLEWVQLLWVEWRPLRSPCRCNIHEVCHNLDST